MALPGKIRLYLIGIYCFFSSVSHSQAGWKADNWQQCFETKKGTITSLWYDIEPFIYKDANGDLQGVEFEIMESLKPYLKNKYGIELKIDWVNAGSFENIYEQVRQTRQGGVFGWSYYSITPERKKQVQFTPPYMPDLNILVTNTSEPVYATAQELTGKLGEMQAYTMANTTMEEDIVSLKKNFYSHLKIENKEDDYLVMKQIAANRNGFGYVPLSVYIVGLQKGIKVKRQNILTARREGFAAVMPLQSDWKELVDEYFRSEDFISKANIIVSKYLGSEVTDLVLPSKDPGNNMMSDLQLVSLEKEIVTKRLLETALQVQRERNLRSIIIAAIGLGLVFFFLTYRRYISKQRINKELMKRNEIITSQKKEIEKINRRLELKFLQSRLNPHFLFNSLNAIQYFVGTNDRKAALKYISSFALFLRQHLQTAASLRHTVLKESGLLNQYLLLEKNRFTGKFDFSVTIPQEPELLELDIPSLLTLSFVEFALYNRVLNRNDSNGFISIAFSQEANQLLIKIEDNGIGKKLTSYPATEAGFSELTPDAELVQQRMKLLNADPANKEIDVEEMDITNEQGMITGTRSIIRINAMAESYQ